MSGDEAVVASRQALVVYRVQLSPDGQVIQSAPTWDELPVSLPLVKRFAPARPVAIDQRQGAPAVEQAT
jgi:hypothetical protein